MEAEPAPPGDLKRLVRGLKDKAEAAAISRMLEQTLWNRRKAARRSNISYKALLYKIRQYNLQPCGRSPAAPSLVRPVA